jgi:hypothetical protein
MALKMPVPTEEARQALRDGAALFTDNDDALARLLAAAPVGLRIFDLTLDDAGAKQLKLEPAAWRFLASNEAGTFISGEVTRMKDGRLKLTSISRDPDSAKPFYVAKQIEHVRRVEDGKFTMAILRIPGILMEALLLESEDGAERLIVPVLTPARDVRLRIVHEAAEFLETIAPLVARFRKFDELRPKY